MKAKEKAKELVERFIPFTMCVIEKDTIALAKSCALIAVEEIITANPHSNPFNTGVYSTMDFWIEVKSEIEKL